jgi:hypothetical protein
MLISRLTLATVQQEPTPWKEVKTIIKNSKKYLWMKWLGKLFPYGNFQINLCLVLTYVSKYIGKKRNENHILKVKWIGTSNQHATKSHSSYIIDIDKISTTQIKVQKFQATMPNQSSICVSLIEQSEQIQHPSCIYHYQYEHVIIECNFYRSGVVAIAKHKEIVPEDHHVQICHSLHKVCT